MNAIGELRPQGREALLRQLQQSASVPIDAAFALPAEYYANASVYELETERLFLKEWLCVGRASDMPRKGDYLTLDVAGQAIMAVRQGDGTIAAMSRACRHRGALVGSPGGGNARLFVCPYHRWVYQLDGSLRAASTMQGNAAFDRADCSLRRYQSAVWQGFVFVSFASDANPSDLEGELEPVAKRVAAYGLEQLRTGFTLEEDWLANWKVALENGSESYHHLGVHTQTLEPFYPALGTRCEPGGAAFNLHSVPGGASQAVADQAERLNPGLSRIERSQLLVIGIYPTLVLVFSGAMATWFTFMPQGVRTTRVRSGWLVPKTYLEGSDAEARLGEDRAILGSILAEDARTCASVQRGLETPGAAPGPLSPLERPIAEFVRYLNAKLNA